MKKFRQAKLWIIYISLSLLLVGCQIPTPLAGVNAWIDVPVDGIAVPEGTVLQIEGHATSPEGVSKVKIWINGNLQFELTELSAIDDLFRFSQEWTPPEAGEYTIQVLAIGGNGSASEADNARVQVGMPVAEVQSVPEEEAVLQDETPITSTPTPTVTPTLPPSVVIDFWADPGTINTGERFTVYWHVENVKTVIFGGIEQPFDGSYSDDLCKNERYTLTVIHTDGTEEKRTVDITVIGSCTTPTFTPTPTSTPVPADTTAPSAPTQYKPISGSDMGCVGSIMMRWEAVSDASGIAQYQVEVQRHPGDSNWSNASGSPFSVSGAEKEISVECGWEYRWRVRAIDGAGNVGNWSGWFTFNVPLI